MKKLALLVLIITAFTASAAFGDANDLIASSTAMINEIASHSDASDMAESLRSSYAVAIVPSMFKAGFGFGGSYGEGLILVHQNGKWYGPSFYNIGGPSIGFQIGIESVSLLLSVVNQRGVRAFLNSKTKLGGDIAIAAGPVGRRAEAATDAQAKASIYSYSISKGLFAGLSLEGSVIGISVKHNSQYWGSRITASDAITKPATDKRIQPLIKALNNLMSK